MTDFEDTIKQFPHIANRQSNDSESKGIPLDFGFMPPKKFPIEALGDDLALLSEETHRIIKSPLAIGSQTILSAISLVLQPHANIVLEGRIHPISLFFFTVAKSGERKTAVDNVILRPLRDHEEEKQVKYLSDLETYQKNLADYTGLTGRNKIDVNLIKPREPLMLMQEPSYEGLIRALDEGQPSVGIFSDEGGRFVHGHGMQIENKLKTITGLCELWDGSAISRVRQKEGSKKLYGKRLSFHLMLQPQIANSVFQDASLIDQGFLGRCLLSFPLSLMGSRKYINENIYESDSYKKYYMKIKSILELPFSYKSKQANSLNPKLLPLSPDSKKLYVDFYNEIESELNEKGKYYPIASFANKSLEHACRIAGCLTMYSDVTHTEITAYFMGNAITLMRYYLHEALRLLGNPELNLDYATCREKKREAKELFDWMIEQKKTEKRFLDGIVTGREIQRFAPNKYRDKEIYQRLVQILIDHEWLEVIENWRKWMLNI